MPQLNINNELLPMKIHYFIGMAGSASILPFLATVSKQRGYSAVVVGLIFTIHAIPGLLLKPIVGAVTDKYKCHKLIIISIQIVRSVIVCVLILIPGKTVENELKNTDVIKSPQFWLFLCCVILLNTGDFIISVVDDTLCIGLLGKNKHKYGHQRLWASIGWGSMSFISGLCVDWYSNGLKHKDYTLGLIFSLTYWLLDIYVISKIKVVQKTDTEIQTTGIKKIFTEVKVLTFLLWVIAFGIFTSSITYFLFLYMEDLSDNYHPETKSWIKTLQGFSITIQCAGEVPLFLLSSFILKRMNHMDVLSITFFTFSVRLFLYSVIRNPVWILPVGLLHGITFALAYSAIVSYTAHIAPVGTEGMLQGITAMTSKGIGFPIGSFLTGYFFDHFGSITTFKLLSGIALATCVIQIIVNIWINRQTENRKVQDSVYSKVNVKENAGEETTTI